MRPEATGRRPPPAHSLDWNRDGGTWPNNASSRFVTAAGLSWHVQVMGRGPMMLLVHGTGASTHSWRALGPVLARDFTVVAPDLPGHAFTSEGDAARMSLPGMAAGVGELMQVMGVAPRILVGHSAGAAILARLCLDGVLTPAGLISLNGAMLPIGGIAGQVFSPLAKLLAQTSVASRLFAWHANGPGVVERLIAQTGSRLDPDGLALYGRLARDPRHAASAISMMANWDLHRLERDLPRLKVPLTLVVGGHDRTIEPGDAVKIRDAVPGARIEYLRNLGHLAHEERPERVAALIVRQAVEWDVRPAPA